MNTGKVLADHRIHDDFPSRLTTYAQAIQAGDPANP
jgi:hypothetical protein